MVEVKVEFPSGTTAKIAEPSIARTEVYLKGGETFTSDTYTVTVPEGKFAKVVVKCIVTEISEEEYNQAVPKE